MIKAVKSQKSKIKTKQAKKVKAYNRKMGK